MGKDRKHSSFGPTPAGLSRAGSQYNSKCCCWQNCKLDLVTVSASGHVDLRWKMMRNVYWTDEFVQTLCLYFNGAYVERQNILWTQLLGMLCCYRGKINLRLSCFYQSIWKILPLSFCEQVSFHSFTVCLTLNTVGQENSKVLFRTFCLVLRGVSEEEPKCWEIRRLVNAMRNLFCILQLLLLHGLL